MHGVVRVDPDIIIRHRQSMILQWVPLDVAQTDDVSEQIVLDAIS